ncbi:gene transfer agent family protein [Sinorhizobium medicae]|uniref:gene transfer agent family protein n=1 Tax=Sinorhizobium medicae TaxID=110321 RepID=UPI001F48DE71|nr:gene transfer agent family protein [Sinorhizobium medicae]
MANPHRGSVAFNVGDRAYTLSFSINAICELEELLGQPVPQIAATLNKPEEIRMTTVRALIWAALVLPHPRVFPENYAVASLGCSRMPHGLLRSCSRTWCG